MVRVKTILSILTLCVALIGYLPLAPYLDPLATWAFPVALLFAWFQQRTDRSLSGRLLTPASILLFLYYASGMNRDNLLSVTANLLVMFLSIRLVGEKSGRNYLQIFALALFCLAASSLYNLSALFLVYLLALLLLLAVSLVVLTFHAHDAKLVLEHRQLKKVLGVAGLMPVAALPLLLVLFVILPRTQFPLWDFLNRGGGNRTGFSDTVKPGATASVSEVKAVVLRVTSPKIPENRLYWRGIVLNALQGNAWVRVPGPEEHSLVPTSGELIHQEIYPEPTNSPYLVALNIPRQITGLRTANEAGVVFKVRAPLEKRVKYEAVSSLSDLVRVKGGIDRDFYLQVPAVVSPRLQGAAREISRPGATDVEKLRLLERFMRSQRISYATSGLPVGNQALDDFLFARKRGNCEFFASSSALLLRLAGIPARLVGGYRGGNYNEMGGYYQVTEDMAHVWVEAYLDGRGWVTLDPTAWSIGFGRRAALGDTLRMYVDTLGFYWNKAVITYDLDKQISLMRKAGGAVRQLHLPSFSVKGALVWIAWLVPLGGALLWYLVGSVSWEERVLRRFLRAVARRYPTVAAEHNGLFDLAQRTGDPQVAEFAAIYGSAIYQDRRLEPGELDNLKQLVRVINQHRP
ncbi:membrane protein [Geomonas limicola]|uniref:Membrane protein n=1 Tax=Geomonas limicola TaxID=2740186 RepID=A0A6V8NCH5_9BACT|nr:DUF3488 and transglutaminase-like domain-containing protein [Geomonas limicola]GFO70231.1 membrane protein [Geomonas limicola]